jgi:xanthine/uracil permease
MNAILIFFNENSTYIAIVIAIIVGLLVYISFKNIDLNKTTTKKLTQTVTVETFGPMDNGTGLGANLPQDTDFSGDNSF